MVLDKESVQCNVIKVPFAFKNTEWITYTYSAKYLQDVIWLICTQKMSNFLFVLCTNVTIQAYPHMHTHTHTHTHCNSCMTLILG